MAFSSNSIERLVTFLESERGNSGWYSLLLRGPSIIRAFRWCEWHPTQAYNEKELDYEMRKGEYCTSGEDSAGSELETVQNLCKANNKSVEFDIDVYKKLNASFTPIAHPLPPPDAMTVPTNTVVTQPEKVKKKRKKRRLSLCHQKCRRSRT